MKYALERHELGEARVIPILIRPVDWQGAPFAKLRFFRKNAQPVTAWANQDLAFLDIAIQIRRVVSELETLHLKKYTQGSDSQKPLKNIEGELIDAVEGAKGNLQHEYASRPVSQVIKQFRLCQKKVEELKSIHNMLHEIEVQLEGLSAMIYLVTREERGGRKSIGKWFRRR